ncbi:MAG: universal stress protein [Desulfobacterales bacterium]|nr:universal stress protein [Desulfobacterales bacterium]
MKEVGKLLHVTDIRQPSFSEVEGLLSLLGLKEVIFLHTTKVEDWDGRFADYGLKSKTFVVDEPLVPAILDTAHQEAVSLIAASLNRDKRRLLRGSLTTELLRASTLPVLVLPEDAQASVSVERGVFTHLVFATDWSPASEKALRYLLSLDLKTITKTLEIVHVIDKKLSVRDIHDLKYKLTESRKIFLDHGIDAEGHVYAGKPSEEIMLAARDYDATCIVMGTTGKSALKDLLSPSYSYRVAEASVVPTLVVP